MNRPTRRDVFFGPVIVILLIVFSTAALVNCGGEKMTVQKENKAVALRFWQEGWKQGNQAIFDEVCAPDLVNHDPLHTGVTDLETYKEHVAFYTTAFPNEGGVTIDDMVAQGDRVIVRWTWEVTHEGEVMNILPTGNRLVLTGITVHRFADGRVAENWHLYDAMGFLQQLGAVPPMGRKDFAWGQPMQPEEGASGDPRANVAVYRREAEELWNRKKLDVVDEIFTADFVNHDPAWPGVTDRATFKGWATAWLSRAPDMEVTIDDIVAQGDKVATRWTCRWTDVAGMQGVEPTGKQIVVTGADICRFTDGRIAERWWAKDLLGGMQQMGVVPPLEAPAQ